MKCAQKTYYKLEHLTNYYYHRCDVMKQYYCLFHKRWLNVENLKSKCLKNKKVKGVVKKCKHLIILEEVKENE